MQATEICGGHSLRIGKACVFTNGVPHLSQFLHGAPQEGHKEGATVGNMYIVGSDTSSLPPFLPRLNLVNLPATAAITTPTLCCHSCCTVKNPPDKAPQSAFA